MALELERDIDLLDLGRTTVAEVARRVEKGDCTFRCQLLASRFYEALRLEARRTYAFMAKHAPLAQAVDRCERAAKPDIAPAMILAELRIAVAMLDRAFHVEAGERARPQGPPQLRVIQGGLSLVQ
jgi:hypothetical protein